MKWEISVLGLEPEILLEFLDTPGDEIAPRSNKVGKDFEDY
jgi:hypothetical protein